MADASIVTSSTEGIPSLSTTLGVSYRSWENVEFVSSSQLSDIRNDQPICFGIGVAIHKRRFVWTTVSVSISDKLLILEAVQLVDVRLTGFD